MRCILRRETEPYFNLAAEEYVFKNFTDDTFMLWKNDPSVIVGKHQNAFAEVNHQFIEERGIKVVRRISGGGTVYHDHGNLNFTFTSQGDPNHLVDFNKYNQVIVKVLDKLGIQADIGPRNSLFINGRKISGNAEHVYKNKVLHHGTLLFNSDLNNLEKAISPANLNYEDKAVKSISSKVNNINNFLQQSLGIDEFTDFIIAEMLKSDSEAYLYTFSEEDIRQINLLKDEKYTKWEWNYGYSPAFSFSTVLLTGDKSFPATIIVKNGIIEDIKVDENQSDILEIISLIDSLRSVKLQESSIIEALREKYSTEQVGLIIHSLFVGGTAEHLYKINV